MNKDSNPIRERLDLVRSELERTRNKVRELEARLAELEWVASLTVTSQKTGFILPPARGEKMQALLQTLGDAEELGLTFKQLILKATESSGLPISEPAARSQLSQAVRRGWVIKQGQLFRLAPRFTWEWRGGAGG
jgi:hypothetical protein